MSVGIIAVTIAVTAAVVYLVDRLIIQPYHKYQKLLSQPGVVAAAPFRPLIGIIFDAIFAAIRGRIVEFPSDLYAEHKDARMLVMTFGTQIALNCIDVDYIAEAFHLQHALSFSKGAATSKVLAPVIGPSSLFLVAIPQHSTHRKMIAPAFHYSSLMRLLPIMQRVIGNAVDHITSAGEVNLIEWLQSLTFDVLAASACGDSLSSIDGANRIIRQATSDIVEKSTIRSLLSVDNIPFVSALPILYQQDIQQNSERIRQIFTQMIQCRRHQSVTSGVDMLDYLMTARDDKGNAFTDTQLQDEIMTFAFAGHSTTSSMMIWIIHQLLQHRHIYDECRTEVDRVCGDSLPTADALNQLTLIDAVIHETLRLYPPAPMLAREALTDITLQPTSRAALHIDKSTLFAIDLLALHRSAHYWSEPNKFNPNRFRVGHSDYRSSLAWSAWMPFGIGHRGCIGSTFALAEAKVMIAILLSKLDIDPAPTQQLPCGLEMKTALLPKNGLRVIIKPRTKAKNKRL